jgi:hypothetical protein
MYPEDTPMLTDPTARPDEPITAGLPVGAGPGPETVKSLAGQDVQQIRDQYLESLIPRANATNVPSFVKFVHALRNAPNA